MVERTKQHPRSVPYETTATATQPEIVYEQGQPCTLDGLLGFRLDEVSWQSLEERYPLLAEAVRDVVNNGYTPQQVRQYLMQREMPLTWARWLEAAARFLWEGSEGG